MNKVQLHSIRTGETHRLTGKMKVDIEYRRDYIYVDVYVPIKDTRGPWQLIVDKREIGIFYTDLRCLAPMHFRAMVDKRTRTGVTMNIKEKEQQLETARKHVQQLESELKVFVDNRLDSLYDLFGKDGPTIRELYVSREELYDILDRWHREDKDGTPA